MTTVWLRQVVRTIRDSSRGEPIDIYVIGYLISLLVITFSTLFTMEVERVWIFMAPFVLIPVAKHLSQRGIADFYWVAGLLCLQLVCLRLRCIRIGDHSGLLEIIKRAAAIITDLAIA